MNKSIKQKSIEWDARMPEIKRLVIDSNYRLKDLANHFNATVNQVNSVLHRRGISLNVLRHSKSLND